ncbi:MAG: lipopolysaccharide kinase InaA family protein [Gammaproteobacteria bacterium]|nr:lipopolysaccharide kinase InaA family protein [Gammaproteobacteria bacterium]
MYIPNNIRQSSKKYTLGEYIIHPTHTNNQSLEQWIKELQFEQYESTTHRMQLHSRKRNNLYSFHLTCVDKEVILKVSQISKHYRWYRKLNLLLIGLIKNYSLNAYYGGIALEKINVDSLKVLGHWTCKRQTQSEKSYLLYEKVNSTMSVYDLCEQVSQTNKNSEAIIVSIAQSLAAVVRNLHRNNIRHGDPHSGNFLLRSSIKNFSQLKPDDVKQMKFTLIDLDKMHFVRNEKPWRKKLLDIRCIRRFRIHNINSTESLNYYLDRPASIIEKYTLVFWMKGGFNIYKWIKPTKKRN